MAPVVHGLEAEYSDRMNFVYLDVDDPNTQELQSALGRRAQPEFFLLDADGNVIQRWFGSVAPEILEDAFAKAGVNQN
jgi:hypothetical protein